MGTHYHLLVETPEPNLSAGMHQLNGLYARLFNVRHGRVGTLFQSRFHAALIETEEHLETAATTSLPTPSEPGSARARKTGPGAGSAG